MHVVTAQVIEHVTRNDAVSKPSSGRAASDVSGRKTIFFPNNHTLLFAQAMRLNTNLSKDRMVLNLELEYLRLRL